MAYLLFLTNNVLFWYFSERISKIAIAIFEISTLKFLSLQNFAKKTKMPKFWAKQPVLANLGPEFANNIVIFKISTLDFV